MRNWLIKHWKNILVFIGEFTTVLLLGLWVLPVWWYSLIIMGAFLIARGFLGKPKHYKSWYLCFVWSVALFLSLFGIARVDLTISLIITGFFALVLTDRFNIGDTFMFAWQHKERKHADAMEYVRRNDSSNPVIADMEKLIENQSDNGIKLVYKYIWKEGRTFTFIKDMLGVESREVSRLSDCVCMLYAKASARHLTEKDL